MTMNDHKLFPQFFILLFAVISLLLNCSCEKSTTESPPPEPGAQAELTLELAHVGLSEAWLRFGIDKIELPQAFSITRDGAVVFADSLYTPDTLLYDSSLAFGSAYAYRAYRLANGQKTDSSTILQVSTMDTTTHNFTWEILAFGDGSSVLRDVAIVNENDIWAVGEINILDSTGNWLNPPYNAVHWNGQQWELKRILYQGGFWSINTIFAFGSDEIWFDAFVKWNGVNFIEMPIPAILIGHSIHKMWGGSSNNLYVVGSQGLIAHYIGSLSAGQAGNWQKLESGTDLPINDIWGSMNQRTGEWEILCIASNQFINQGKRLLRIESAGVAQLPDSGLSWALNTVWYVSGYRYFVGGDGLYHSRTIGPIWYRDVSFPPYYKTSVRGNGINDIVVAGAFGLLMHFNGASWKDYLDIPFMPSGAFARVEVKRNVVVAVGGLDNKGLVLIGQR